ncbi:MAG: tRNA (adenosine(37)-N6)-dimethylallyltransferase MiaA [Clostridiales bacterium]|jgi:tRNA dimethylallyltransferase|nr:tRNA (adenosine(37)-N6)-dimethylallyltransferase MiaA [Clostridiales bacterium]
MVQADSVKQKIIVVAGATATGKSDLAVEAALKFNGRVISADSMQIYRGADIGTGKLPPEKRGGVPHYLIDIKNPDEEFSVGDFITEAQNAVAQTAAAGAVPIIAGGTGLYIDALLNGYNLAAAPKSGAIRAELEAEELPALYAKLKKVDPASAAKISPNDKKRAVRALEIFYVTGKPKSEAAVREAESRYEYKFILLTADRSGLYKKIDARVDAMLRSGLLDEARSLYKYRDCQSMRAIGYKELMAHLDGKLSYADAVEEIKRNTRRYAKRQITYFGRMKADKIAVNIAEKERIFSIMSDIL